MVQPIDLHLATTAEKGPAQAFQSVHLEGCCSLNGGADTSCTMMGLAFDSGVVFSTVPVSFADEVILSLPHLGLQKGAVSRVFEGGFEVHFAQASYSRIWAYLDWLNEVAQDFDRQRRDQERLVPLKKLVDLVRADGPRSIARIVDLSRSGVAFTTSQALSIDEPVTVGLYRGRVVRLFEGGAAVRFDEAIAVDRFDAMIDLSAGDQLALA